MMNNDVFLNKLSSLMDEAKGRGITITARISPPPYIDPWPKMQKMSYKSWKKVPYYNQPCVYGWYLNGELRYIGTTINYDRARADYAIKLRDGKHRNRSLQHIWCMSAKKLFRTKILFNTDTIEEAKEIARDIYINGDHKLTNAVMP